MSEKSLIVTPGNDLDSLLSAAVIYEGLRSIGVCATVCFPPVKNPTEMLRDVEKKYAGCDSVFFTDFPLSIDSYNAVSNIVRKTNGDLYYIDHHKSSLLIGAKDTTRIDMKKNCVQLAMELMTEVLNANVPAIARTLSALSETGEFDGMHHLARAVRLYIKKDKKGKKRAVRDSFALSCSLLRGTSFGRSKWTRIYKSFPRVIEEHYREKNKIDDSIIPDIVIKMLGNGIEAGIVSGDKDSAQSILNSLYAIKNVKCLLLYNICEATGVVRCTIRSIDESAIQVASFLGGDGHYMAANADISLWQFSEKVLGIKPLHTQTQTVIRVVGKEKKKTSSDEIVAGIMMELYGRPVPENMVMDSDRFHRHLLRSTQVLGQKRDKNAIVRCLYLIAMLYYGSEKRGTVDSLVSQFVEKKAAYINQYSGKQLKDSIIEGFANDMLQHWKEVQF